MEGGGGWVWMEEERGGWGGGHEKEVDCCFNFEVGSKGAGGSGGMGGSFAHCERQLGVDGVGGGFECEQRDVRCAVR